MNGRYYLDGKRAGLARLAAMIFLIWLCAVATNEAPAAEPVIIGILAFRPQPQVAQKWQPLEAYLHEAVPEHEFKLQPFSYVEMNEAVANRRLDFVLTN